MMVPYREKCCWTMSSVVKARDSKRSRGFGFVQFDNTNSVEEVMADYSTHQLEGKWIECKRAVPQDRMGGAPPSRGGGGDRGGGDRGGGDRGYGGGRAAP